MGCSKWSDGRKTAQLIIITLAAIVPDFDSGIGTWLIRYNPRRINA